MTRVLEGFKALEGLKVLELAGGIAGPYAGRLLGMLGAEVVKVDLGEGDPAWAMGIDDRPTAAPGPLFVHVNAGKRLVPEVGDLAAWADVVLDDRVAAQRDGTDLDPAELARRGKVVVSITAWGFGADEPGAPTDELLVQAASGIVSATIEDGRPYRFPGWQSQYLAGGFGVVGALTALATPGGHHVEVTWVGSIVTGVEAGLCAFLNAVDQPPRPPTVGRDRQAGFQVGAFPAGVFRCGDGHVIPGTVRPVDWDLQCAVYDRPDLLVDERFDARHRFQHRSELRAELQPWYDAHGKYEIFEKALAAGWACGMVMTAGDALSDPHIASRDFVGEVRVGGIRARVPVQPWRTTEATAAGSKAERPPGPPVPPDLASLKVIELTWAWAGPFVGRYLGAYGADVVRVEAGRYPDGWRTRLKWKQTGAPIPEGVDPESYTWDAAALHNSLNRNKRSLSLDLTDPDGKAVFVELMAEADLLVLNMSYRMLADRGIDDEVAAAVERGLVVLNMPALGATGPYRDMPGYGILMEGMGGFATRYGTRDEQARSTNTYYPDLVAGLHGTVAALSGLAATRTTGRGRVIDLSQQEVTWLQFAEALVLQSIEQREPDRLGDAEPGLAPSGYYSTNDQRWVALLVRDDTQFRALTKAASPHLDAFADLPGDGRCRRRDDLDAALVTWTSTLTADELEALGREEGIPIRRGLTYGDVYGEGTLAGHGVLERLVHPVTGERPYAGLPVVVDGSPWSSVRPAACFAEHTDEVLTEWIGADAKRWADLRERQVIGTTPFSVRRE